MRTKICTGCGSVITIRPRESAPRRKFCSISCCVRFHGAARKAAGVRAWNLGSGGYDRALFQTPIYRVWFNMKTRCSNRRITDYHRYGGRGISVCEKWQRFAGFFEDMGPTYQDGLTIERIDNDAGYTRENCRWATKREQANNRRSNRWFTIDGETKTLEQWIRTVGLNSSLVRSRFYMLKWPIEKALGLEVGSV